MDGGGVALRPDEGRAPRVARPLDGTVEQFTVADSAADERDPSILALEKGELLVAWRKIEDGQSRIAWRVIGSQARRRAVR